jgi:hypothetical protein
MFYILVRVPYDTPPKNIWDLYIKHIILNDFDHKGLGLVFG